MHVRKALLTGAILLCQYVAIAQQGVTNGSATSTHRMVQDDTEPEEPEETEKKESAHNYDALTKSLKLSGDCIGEIKESIDSTDMVYSKTISSMTAALLSNFTLGYNGYGSNSSNGAINVSGDKTQASVTVGLFPLKWHSFFTINANAQISDDAFSIASGGEFSGGYSFEIAAYKRIAGSVFYKKSLSCKQREKGELTSSQLAVLRDDFLAKKAAELKSLEDEDGIKSTLDALRKKVNDAIAGKEKLSDKDLADAMDEIEKNQQKLNRISMANNKSCPSECAKLKDSLVAWESTQVKVNPFSVCYIRASLVYGKEQYTAIDTLHTKLLESQITKIPYDKKGLSVSINQLFKGRYLTYNASFGINYIYNNAFSNASPVSFNDSWVYTDTTNRRRTYTKDFKAYNIVENPYSEFHSIIPRVMWQVFVGQNRNVGFELGTQVSIDCYKDNYTLGVWDAQVGLMYSNVKSDDMKSRYTIQLLFKAKDITTAMIKDNDTFGKKLDVSLRLAVPFTNFFL